MTRRRFYAAPEAFLANHQSVTLSPEETRHLRDVLRHKPGDEVYVFDGVGHEFRCHVQTIGKNSTNLSVIAEVEPASPESPLDLILAVALLKGEKFDLVIQKATELGVTQVLPVITSRSDVRIKGGDDGVRKTVRWQRIALEATKQCGRARLLKVERPIDFADLIKPAEETRVMFVERNGTSLAEAMNEANRPQRVTALVGSEGGWDDDEIERARAAGWKIVTLGGRTLRAETAAIVIATLIQHRFGDLK